MESKDIIKALECISGQASPDFDCDDCRIERSKYTTCEVFVTGHALDLIKNQQAEIEKLQKQKEISNSELAKAINKSLEQAKEIGDLKAEIEMVKAINCRLVVLGDRFREQLKTAKIDTLKEFWQRRPPMFNTDVAGKEERNKGWNDCIDCYFEEYEKYEQELTEKGGGSNA